MTKAIPIRVIQNRGPLSIHQALCVYLCDDPDGPMVSQAEAANLLGLSTRSQVSTHLQRARRIQGDEHT